MTPPEPEQHERAERRVLGDADDRLDARRGHALHDRAAHRVAETVVHRRERGAHRGDVA